MNSKKILPVLLCLCACSLGHSDDEAAKITPVYDEGYWQVSPGQKLRVGGLVEIDGQFFTQDDGNDCTFLVRRARIFLTGNLQDHFGYMVMGRWDNQTPALHYAWIETSVPTYSRVRAGLFTKPFSLEATYSDTYWDFTERSLGGINFVRPRDIGVMAYGIFAKDCIEYGIGVFNGRGPLIDNNNNKDLIGRVSFYPFFTTNNVLKELGLSVSGEIGRYTEDLTGTQFITGQRTAFWRWNDASVNHRRIEWGADLEWMHRAAAVRAEYLHVDWGSVKNGSISEPFRVKSGYVESSYILTGEEQPGNAVLIPNRDLDFKGGWGAWQLAVRYEMCHISHQPLQAKLATGANFSQGPTVALNWFFNAHIEMKMDWQYLHFNHKLPNSSGKNSESVIIARLQSQF